MRGLSVWRGTTRVAADVDLHAPVGSWVCLAGPNGAGKTSTLAALGGLPGLTRTIAAGGGVRVAGLDPGHARRRTLARRVALLPQEPVRVPGMRVGDYLLLGRTPYLSRLRGESAHDRRVARDIAERLDVTALGHREVSELSGGEFARVAIARVLVQQPDVVLLDEPTASLDPGIGLAVLELVDALRRESGLTVVSSLHDLGFAGQFADTVTLLADGRRVASGPPHEVLTPDRLEPVYGARIAVSHVVSRKRPVPLAIRSDEADAAAAGDQTHRTGRIADEHRAPRPAATADHPRTPRPAGARRVAADRAHRRR